jgi:hypothetical protein
MRSSFGELAEALFIGSTQEAVFECAAAASSSPVGGSSGAKKVCDTPAISFHPSQDFALGGVTVPPVAWRSANPSRERRNHGRLHARRGQDASGRSYFRMRAT